MRPIAVLLASLALAGCAGTGGGFQNLAVQPVPTPPRALVQCTPQTVLQEGRETRRYPANCPATAQLQDRYALGREIARLEEELREVNYLIASRDGPRLIGGPNRVFSRGFGSSGFLIGRRVEIRNALRALKAEAART
jgi:hypothetical protein